ncbi:uncharacterized protein LOC116655106 [Drosophila ananassae]|uniref:uncharacterized protein LOC116655106 n=1 Tax=Drosophila ananassae TaxID=7217 RepID=UPI0013A5CADA|nr:uncharacterized protein LOC116655106 [Drosophila ananassae]
MCMPYLSKLFGGNNRAQRRAQDGGITPRPSLANINQVSVDTMRTAKSAVSRKSTRAALREAENNRIVAIEMQGGGTTSSARSAGAAATTVAATASSTGAASGGGANATAATSTAGGAGGRSGQRTSWWEYLGMNKNKKASIESL